MKIREHDTAVFHHSRWRPYFQHHFRDDAQGALAAEDYVIEVRAAGRPRHQGALLQGDDRILRSPGHHSYSHH